MSNPKTNVNSTMEPGPGENKVKSRLHALFTHNQHHNAEAGPSKPRMLEVPNGGLGYEGLNSPGSVGLTNAQTEPILSPSAHGWEPGTVVNRKGIKVFLTTWNMGDALPKGDLSVLFGHVPPYVRPSEQSDELPELPVENAHPYHIVVVAGQECPTDSGVPRGLGGGLMKGMSVRRHLDKERKAKGKEADKDKDKDKDKEKHMDEDHKGKSPENSEQGHDSLVIKLDEIEEERIKTATPGTALPHTHKHPPGAKGWSNMLDDWFCGPTATYAPRTPTPGCRDSPTVPEYSSSDILRSVSAPASPGGNGEFSHGSLTPTAMPIQRAGSHLAVNSITAAHFSRSPLSHSPNSFGSRSQISDSSSASSSNTVSPTRSPVALSSRPLPDVDLPVKSASIPHTGMGQVPPLATAHHLGYHDSNHHHNPEMMIPPEELSFSGRGGTGCYLHLVKQRLMGMYLSVYVYKGCEHLVEGVDKDYVTTGLAGGRLGNKGGIGISLKLAGHRFLFVNAHLAAHTGRQAARLANIAKIKSELRLDCFLPQDDPRSQAEDLTERFDTTFWCGDLNFRLEMSRLHAEWLIEQKKYAEALTWDQLKSFMKETNPSKNPLVGFEEGPIDFAPTFKYDVWRSVKHTNRELRRSLRRNESQRKKTSSELGISFASAGGVLGQLPEAVIEDDGPPDSEDDDAMSHRSFDSSRFGGSNAQSTVGTDIEDGDHLLPDSPTSPTKKERDEAAINGAHNAHRPLDVAVKQKAKQLLQMVKIGGQALSPSPSRRNAIKKKQTQTTEGDMEKRALKAKPSREFLDTPTPTPRFFGDGNITRQESSSTIGSLRDLATAPQYGNSILSTSPENHLRVPVENGGAQPAHNQSGVLAITIDSPLMGRRPSLANSVQSPSQVTVKRFTSLKRTVSGKSLKMAQDDDEEDDMEDNREGVYDTSKKQRVPSWCDRVLWKAHVVPDEHDPPPDTDTERSGRFNRLSVAFADFRGHFRSSLGRSNSVDPAQADRIRISRPAPSPPALVPNDDDTSPKDIRHATPPSTRLVADTNTSNDSPILAPAIESPVSIRDESQTSPPIPPDGAVPGPRKIKELRVKTRRSTLDDPTSPSASRHRHPLLNRSGSHSSPPAKPRITFDPASSPSTDRAPGGGLFRPRANSIGTPPADADNELLRRPGLALTERSRTLSFSPANTPGHSLSNIFGSHSRENSGLGRVKSESATTNGIGPGATSSEIEDPDHEHGKNAFVRFFRDLPHLLHRTSTHSNDAGGDLGQEENNQVVGPPPKPLHKQGEVVCLHYGTIDDAGMRQLEGRSDHRPAIFAAAVYI